MLQLIVPTALNLEGALKKRRFRSEVQRMCATDRAVENGIPLDGAINEECLGWVEAQPGRLCMPDLAALTLNDPARAPHLMWDLHLRGWLAADCYQLTHRVWMYSGTDPVTILGATRWRTLFRSAKGFVHHDVLATPPSEPVVLFLAAAEPPSAQDLIASFVPQPGRAAGQMGLPPGDRQLWARLIEPRRIISVARPSGSLGCGGPWAGCINSEAIVDLRGLKGSALPAALDIFDDELLCDCGEPAPWLGEPDLLSFNVEAEE